MLLVLLDTLAVNALHANLVSILTLSMPPNAHHARLVPILLLLHPLFALLVLPDHSATKLVKTHQTLAFNAQRAHTVQLTAPHALLVQLALSLQPTALHALGVHLALLVMPPDKLQLLHVIHVLLVLSQQSQEVRHAPHVQLEVIKMPLRVHSVINALLVLLDLSKVPLLQLCVVHAPLVIFLIQTELLVAHHANLELSKMPLVKLGVILVLLERLIWVLALHNVTLVKLVNIVILLD